MATIRPGKGDKVIGGELGEGVLIDGVDISAEFADVNTKLANVGGAKTKFTTLYDLPTSAWPSGITESQPVVLAQVNVPAGVLESFEIEVTEAFAASGTAMTDEAAHIVMRPLSGADINNDNLIAESELYSPIGLNAQFTYAESSGAFTSSPIILLGKVGRGERQCNVVVPQGGAVIQVVCLQPASNPTVGAFLFKVSVQETADFDPTAQDFTSLFLENFDSLTPLDPPPNTFTTGGDADWKVTSTSGSINLFASGTRGVGSGDIAAGQTSWLNYAPASDLKIGDVLSFQWATSSEAGKDFLSFSVTVGGVTTTIAQKSGFSSTSVPFERILWVAQTDAPHTFRWTYSKDAAGDGGLDRGFLDTIQLWRRPDPVTAANRVVMDSYELVEVGTPITSVNFNSELLVGTDYDSWKVSVATLPGGSVYAEETGLTAVATSVPAYTADSSQTVTLADTDTPGGHHYIGKFSANPSSSGSWDDYPGSSFIKLSNSQLDQLNPNALYTELAIYYSQYSIRDFDAVIHFKKKSDGSGAKTTTTVPSSATGVAVIATDVDQVHSIEFIDPQTGGPHFLGGGQAGVARQYIYQQNPANNAGRTTIKEFETYAYMLSSYLPGQRYPSQDWDLHAIGTKTLFEEPQIVSNPTVQPTLVCDAATTAEVMVEGTDAAGAVQYEFVTMNGTTAVNMASGKHWATITGIRSGQVNLSNWTAGVVGTPTTDASSWTPGTFKFTFGGVSFLDRNLVAKLSDRKATHAYTTSDTTDGREVSLTQFDYYGPGSAVRSNLSIKHPSRFDQDMRLVVVYQKESDPAVVAKANCDFATTDSDDTNILTDVRAVHSIEFRKQSDGSLHYAYNSSSAAAADLNNKIHQNDGSVFVAIKNFYMIPQGSSFDADKHVQILGKESFFPVPRRLANPTTTPKLLCDKATPANNNQSYHNTASMVEVVVEGTDANGAEQLELVRLNNSTPVTMASGKTWNTIKGIHSGNLNNAGYDDGVTTWSDHWSPSDFKLAFLDINFVDPHMYIDKGSTGTGNFTISTHDGSPLGPRTFHIYGKSGGNAVSGPAGGAGFTLTAAEGRLSSYTSSVAYTDVYGVMASSDVIDPHWNNVSVLIPGPVIEDKSDNNLTVMRQWDAHSDSREIPASPVDEKNRLWGRDTLNFDGHYDSVTVSPSAGLAFGTGDFTVDGWSYMEDYLTSAYTAGVFQISHDRFANPDITNSVALVMEHSNASATYNPAADLWTVYANGGYSPTTVTYNRNQWYHFALVRSSGTLKLYIDGTEIYSVADTTDYTGQYCTIGSAYGATSYNFTQNNTLNGNVADFRVTKGVARYTANFTRPERPAPIKGSDTHHVFKWENDVHAFALPPGSTKAGIVEPAGGAMSLGGKEAYITSPHTGDILITGTDENGADQQEVLTLASGSAPQSTVKKWNTVVRVAFGQVTDSPDIKVASAPSSSIAITANGDYRATASATTSANVTVAGTSTDFTISTI